MRVGQKIVLARKPVPPSPLLMVQEGTWATVGFASSGACIGQACPHRGAYVVHDSCERHSPHDGARRGMLRKNTWVTPTRRRPLTRIPRTRATEYDSAHMPQGMPAILADEITVSDGPWTLSNARLRPTARERKPSFGVSIGMAGRDVCSDVALWGAPPAAREAAAALRRSGYEILRLRSKPFHARRPLHGSRELDAEVYRLEALAADASSLALFPPRRARRPGLRHGAGHFPTMLFQRLRQSHAWSLESVVVHRKGPPAFVRAPAWTAGAWCLALDDGDDRLIEIHVQVFLKSSSTNLDSNELARLTRTFRSQLGPLGYTTVKVNWSKKRSLFAVFEKRLPTLAVARRERRRLDHTLFGD